MLSATTSPRVPDLHFQLAWEAILPWFPGPFLAQLGWEGDWGSEPGSGSCFDHLQDPRPGRVRQAACTQSRARSAKPQMDNSGWNQAMKR